MTSKPAMQYHMFALLMLLFVLCGECWAQTTAFTYQGKLTDGGNPANGNYDLQFKLFDTATVGTGTQQGNTVTVSNVSVNNGIFTVQLDFGACASCFNGAARFLEIAVKPTGGGSFTMLSPRQPFTSSPYAIKSLNAATADGLSVACVNCVTSTQIGSVNGSAVTGQIPVASVPAGSGNYIQNTTSTQAASNFNISGNGTAGGTLSGNLVNAATQYNLAGNRALSVSGVGSFVNSNTFAGIGAGAATTPDGSGFGSLNSFFGQSAGNLNTTGRYNSFFGSTAGANNTTGFGNTFIGNAANFNTTNTTGNNNTLLGGGTQVVSGLSNATAIGALASVTQSNSLVLGSIFGINGSLADTNVGIGTTAPAFRLHVVGDINTTTQYNLAGNRVLGVSGVGSFVNTNTFAGIGAGAATTPDANGQGTRNSFFGNSAGLSNTTGDSNSFFGQLAGRLTTTGRLNSFFGVGTGFSNTEGNQNSFFGQAAGINTTMGGNNSFFGVGAGSFNTTGFGNTFIGTLADFNTTNTTGSNNTLLGYSSLVNSGLSNATAIGAFAQVTQSNSLVLGSINGVNGATANTNVGIGTTAPIGRLQIVTDDDNNPGVIAAWDGRHFVIGRTASIGGIGMSYSQATGVGYIEALIPNLAWGNLVLQSGGGRVGIGTASPLDTLDVNGGIRTGLRAGGTIPLCLNLSSQISSCSSSLRYKTNLAPFRSGLNLIQHLSPITFNWKTGGAADLGLAAEDVAKVEPLLVTHNAKGEVEGVKYDRLGVVLINAVREQQALIEQYRQQLTTQRWQLAAQQSDIAALQRWVCRRSPKAALCQPNQKSSIKPAGAACVGSPVQAITSRSARQFVSKF